MHRRDLKTLSSSELTELANLIRGHVTQAVLDAHEAWHQMHGSGGMIGPGSGEHFLDFHRNFIKNLENALINRGKNQYVPLPKWNPADPIPAEFSHPGRSTNNPGISPPSWITLAGGSIGDPVFGYTSLGQFKSLMNWGGRWDLTFMAWFT
ncbi:hypothetical protein QVH35_10015 [Candidatus Nitrosotenuis chungbukensis]|uniref:hypothetical protein n=1 Tax=Candidatus Nitrosotenuis chungbukensis TaxID=1353246 RepID=UPI0026727595|nr:hypothetical protein [Candidatus Nitrosotenuis chungbukensis]WKT57654.1 hypothetical protein QVH35_10015 [Candidatus Nitrosotenuis chungbukensis]